MAVKPESKLKRRKKRWFPILAPKMFNNKAVGESYVADPSLLEGKSLTANLMTITGDMRSQNVNIGFEVETVTDGKGYTKLVSYAIIPSSLKRFIRRGRSRIDDSIILKTADKKFIQVKPVIITQFLETRLVRTQLRLQTRKMLFSMAQAYTYEKLASEIIFQRMQKQIRDVLKKITPVKSVGIRMFKLLKTEPKIYLSKADYALKKEPAPKKKPLQEEQDAEEKPSEVKPSEQKAVEAPAEKKEKKTMPKTAKKAVKKKAKDL